MRILLSLFLMSLLAGCGSNQYTSPVFSADGQYEGNDGSSYNLIPFSDDNTVQHAIKLDAEGRIIEEGLLFHNLKDGAWVTYDYKFQRDQIETVTNYMDGLKHGPYHVYENGQLKEKGTYYQSQKDGVIKNYNRGRIAEELTYQDGVLNGPVKRYYEDGKLKEEGDFLNGQREGEHKWYNIEGGVIIQYTYKNGQKVE